MIRFDLIRKIFFGSTAPAGTRPTSPEHSHARHRRSAPLILACAAACVLLLTPRPVRADFRHARMGPRPRAMGSAFIAVADDANAVYWNPSGMTQLERFEITGCRTLLYGVDELSNDYISMAYHWRGIAAFGVSWVRLDLEDIYHEDTINLAVAGNVPWLDGLSVGGSLKIFNLSAPGYEKYNDPAYEGRDIKPGFDLGIHYSSKRNWTIGAVLYNLNEPKLKLLRTTEHPDPVYRDMAIGASYIFSDLLLLSYDLKTRYGDLGNTIGRIGSEVWFFEAVALRGGFEQEHMTAGFGLKHDRWQVDVMLETHYELGNTYQFAATIRL